MKKPVSKSDLRRALLEETRRFLDEGGRVSEIPDGVSGRDPEDPPLFLHRQLFVEPKTPRTLVPEVIAAIEARRLEKPARKSRSRRTASKPRRKTIYDDFGEPLRRVWTDD